MKCERVFCFYYDGGFDFCKMCMEGGKEFSTKEIPTTLREIINLIYKPLDNDIKLYILKRGKKEIVEEAGLIKRAIIL